MAKIIKMKTWLKEEAKRTEQSIMEEEMRVYEYVLEGAVLLRPALVKRLVKFCQEELLGEEV